MNEAERVDRAARRKQAEARLARSRPARDAAAAAHAGRMGSRAWSGETGHATVKRKQPPELSALERKVLEAADDILVSKGEEGQRLAELVRDFVRSQ